MISVRKFVILLFLVSFAATGTINAQDTEALEETRALGFVKQVQVGDVDSLLAYMHENWVPEKPEANRATRWPRVANTLIERHPGLKVVGVTTEQPHNLAIITEDAKGSTISFIFEFQPDPPHLIVGMGLEAGPPMPKSDLPEFVIPAAANLDQITDALEKWFKDLAENDKFSGTAMVARHGEPIFSGAYGLASIRWQVPNNLDTRFDLGSINKTFTKIAIGQLLSQEKLSLDDIIATHLPNYPNEEVARKVTIRHLLDHTSGLGDIFTEEFSSSSKSLYREPRDFFPLFADQPLQFEPGDGQSYSNAGYMVLGAIIEEISGEPYDAYVARTIFEPAGMTSSGFFSRDDPVENVATGYTRMSEGEEAAELQSNVFLLPARGNSAGSAQSTVSDLLKFDNALREHRLLDPEYTEWYFGGAEPKPDSPQAVSSKRAAATTGIAGGAPGVSAVIESSDKLAVIVLSNYDSPIAMSVARGLFRPLEKALADSN